MARFFDLRSWTLFGRCWLAMLLALVCSHARAQEFDFVGFDGGSPGPWSSAERTTLTIPQVTNGAITIDGVASDAEYGGFLPVSLVPGGETDGAWIWDQPETRAWDGVEDSSLMFWMAHDTDYLYIGAQVADDTVNVDSAADALWQDDALDLVFHSENNRYDHDAGTAEAGLGGHASVSAAGQAAATFSREVALGETGDLHSVGQQVEGGWSLEVRVRKSVLEAPGEGVELVEGYTMGFNLGLSDDDGRGTQGSSGSGEVEADLEAQYWWANRNRFLGWDEDEAIFYLESEIENSMNAIREERDDLGELGAFLEAAIDADGRLRPGGAGEIVFGGLASIGLDCSGNGEVDAADLACVTQESLADLIAALGSIEGDLNGNGVVDFPDFLVLSQNFGLAVDSYQDGDINLDGSVNFTDFLVFSQNFGQSGAAASVPEPGMSVLWGALLLTVCGLRRQRRG